MWGTQTWGATAWGRSNRILLHFCIRPTFRGNETRPRLETSRKINASDSSNHQTKVICNNYWTSVLTKRRHSRHLYQSPTVRGITTKKTVKSAQRRENQRKYAGRLIATKANDDRYF